MDLRHGRRSGDKRLVFVATLDCNVRVFFEDSCKLFLNLYGHKLLALGWTAATTTPSWRREELVSSVLDNFTPSERVEPTTKQNICPSSSQTTSNRSRVANAPRTPLLCRQDH